MRQEWRVLRFNDITRQSVSRVVIVDDAAVTGELQQQQQWWRETHQNVAAVPHCIAQEYLKTQVSLFAALIGLQGLVGLTGASTRRVSMLRVLLIGVGGGTMPLFLSNIFTFLEIDAVEIDPVVVEAAITAMGLPPECRRCTVHTADAVQFVQAHKAAQKPPYDVVCIDAFDGEDSVPGVLCEAPFVSELAQVMHPRHGTLMANFHSTEIRLIAGVYKSALLGVENAGSCFSVSTHKQTNVAVVCARGLALPEEGTKAKEQLRLAAASVGHEFGYPFPAGSRASRNYSKL